ncbi:MAG: SecD/SecF fusion protein, partial [Sphingobacteriales bacterium]
AFWAVLMSMIIVFIYLLIRFRKWQFGLGALFALVHDVLFILGLFSLLNGVVPFSLDIDQAFIAAILTVVGYSINDTVVVFDRIREYLNLHHSKNADIEPIINDALNSTLSRTIITAVTTFFVLLVLFIFGGEVIRGFTFAMLVGVVVGTYSSIFIATPVVVDFMKKKKVK